MDRRTRNLFALALVALIAVTGGAAILFGVGGFGGSADQSVVGVIVGVDSEGLDRVRGFSLRTEDARTLAFAIGDLENGTTFPPGHLVEHQATAQRVRVWYVVDGGANVAVRLEDSP
jgi:hypothetical protein